MRIALAVCAAVVFTVIFAAIPFAGATGQEVRPPTGPGDKQVRALDCKTVSHDKWNRWVRREIRADGNSRRLRKSPVCVSAYVKLKRHVIKVERANCVGRGVICWIEKAAKKYGQSLADAIRVARCESGLDPGQVNGESVGSEHASGLFQFLPSTWQTTPYRTRNIFNPKWNSLAAMYMWSVGRRGEWVCQ